MGTRVAALIAAAATWACAGGVPTPVPVEPGATCGYCRMVVSDQRFASELLAPYEEPRFFDDLGCLRHYLDRTGPLRPGAVVYVADHRSRAWVLAGRAVYTRVESLSAPMGSHIIAHESIASRDADADAARGTPIDVTGVFGPTPIPGGSS